MSSTSTQYTKGLIKILNGSISLLGDNLKFLILKEGYVPNFDQDEFVSNIDASYRITSTSSLGGKIFNIDTEPEPPGSHQVYFTCNPLSFSGAQGIIIKSIVLYKDTGSVETSPLISYFNGQSVSYEMGNGLVGINVGSLGLLRWVR